MTISAGARRHCLTLQQKQELQDEMGEPVRSWSIVKQVFAALRPLNVMERTEASKLVGEATHLVTIGGMEGPVTPDMRFLFTDIMGIEHVFEVVGEMNYDMASFELRIMVRERV